MVSEAFSCLRVVFGIAPTHCVEIIGKPPRAWERGSVRFSQAQNKSVLSDYGVFANTRLSQIPRVVMMFANTRRVDGRSDLAFALRFVNMRWEDWLFLLPLRIFRIAFFDLRGKLALRHHWASSTRVLLRPHRKPAWPSEWVFLRMSGGTGIPKGGNLEVWLWQLVGVHGWRNHFEFATYT